MNSRATAPSPAPEPRYIRRSDLPKVYGISLRIISSWQRNGLLPYSKPSRKITLFKVADVEGILKRFEVRSGIGGMK